MVFKGNLLIFKKPFPVKIPPSKSKENCSLELFLISLLISKYPFNLVFNFKLDLLFHSIDIFASYLL